MFWFIERFNSQLKAISFMTVFITMLRGINVSGQKKIKMEDLRKLYESLDFEQVQTYIQSGNVIFKAFALDSNEIVYKIKDKINQKFGYEVTVVIRTRDEMEKIVENNPYSAKDLSKVHVTFLKDDQYDYSIEELLKVKAEQEEFQIMEKEIYLFLPHGSGRTKLTNNFFEKKLGVKATTRNWNTTSKLLDISKSL